MTVNWVGTIGSALAIGIFLGPFAYKHRRSRDGSHFRATLDVMLVFGLLLLWIAGVSNALYGLGLVVDEPPQILGSGGYDPGQSHVEHMRLPYLGVGLALMVSAWIIGRISELRK